MVCNRLSKCRKFACVKAGHKCSNCLPSRLGNCDNQRACLEPEDLDSQLGPTITTLPPSHSTLSTTGEAPPIVNQTPPTFIPDCSQTASDCPLSTSTISTPTLPRYPSQNPPTFTRGTLNGPDFTILLDKTYKEVISWRRNCFSVPTSKAGREFVSELARMYQAFGSAAALELVALKASIVLPILLLQKPCKASKTKNHVKCLERRLQYWLNGELDELVREGRTIQQRLPKSRPARADSNIARTFSNLMFKGKCKAALDLLSESDKGGILHLDARVNPDDLSSPTVREALLQKHPPSQKLHSECIVDEEPQEPHPVIFESLDASVIRSAALKIYGAAGPSGLDAHEWRRLCTNHKGASRDLCTSLAAVAQRLCSSYVDPATIKPLLASRLIALDKQPGVRPIGIGDTAQRIIAKVVLTIVASDVQETAGCSRMCGGQISGIEAAVHATRSAFELEENEAILLVGATNAFNTLNRQVALHNIRPLHCNHTHQLV